MPEFTALGAAGATALAAATTAAVGRTMLGLWHLVTLPAVQVAVLAAVIACGIANAGVKTTLAALAFFAVWLVLMARVANLA